MCIFICVHERVCDRVRVCGHVNLSHHSFLYFFFLYTRCFKFSVAGEKLPGFQRCTYASLNMGLDMYG